MGSQNRPRGHSLFQMRSINRQNSTANSKTAKRLAQEAEIIAKIGRTIGSTLNINEVYEKFAKEAKKLIPFNRVAINLINYGEGTVTAAYESGTAVPGRRVGYVHPLKKSFNEMILRTRSPQILHPSSLEEMEKQFPAMGAVYRAGLRSMMGAPLISRNLVIGTLHFRSKNARAYNDHHCRLAERIANQIAGAISNAQLYLEQELIQRALKKSEKELRLLSSHLLAAQEMERKRISRELHDEYVQALALLKLKITFIENGLNKNQDNLENECEQILRYIDQIIENVRRLIRDLRPPILEDFGLISALERLAAEFSKHYHVYASVEADKMNGSFSLKFQEMIYRIIQEAMNNIGKHAQARNVKIRIKKIKKKFHFIVEDDGKGFSVSQIKRLKPEEKGLGLISMEERARMLGGLFEIRSRKGKGTRLMLAVPVKMKGAY
jgi:signal transduction histidine kinase